LSALCAAVLRPLFPTEAMLAHRQVVRRRTRSTLTVGVLYVALSAGIGLGTAILNNVQDVRTWQERTFIGDFFIRANKPDLATGKSAPMPDSVETEVRSVAGVTSIDGVRVVEQVKIQAARAGGEPQEVGAVLRDFDAGDRLPMDLKVGDLQETRSRLRAGEVVIGTVVAHRMGLRAGEEIILQTRQGPKKLRIAGETNDYWLAGRVMYMDRSLGRKLLGADGADMYIVHTTPAALTEVDASLKAICSRDGFSLLSFATLRRRLDDLLNSIVAGLWGIMALGLVVAGFAVANTLTMNVLEQTREIAMLRVVAMTRRQVRRTILAQAAILGLFGVTLGVISGAISSYTMNLCTPAVTGRPIDFALHPGLLIGTYLVALGIILIAAWLPARRATHLNLLIALQYE
jgi:putative ABC transport system permease protein